MVWVLLAVVSRALVSEAVLGCTARVCLVRVTVLRSAATTMCAALATSRRVLFDAVLLKHQGRVILISTIVVDIVLLTVVVSRLKSIEASHVEVGLLELVFEGLVEVIELARLTGCGPV